MIVLHQMKNLKLMATLMRLMKAASMKMLMIRRNKEDTTRQEKSPRVCILTTLQMMMEEITTAAQAQNIHLGKMKHYSHPKERGKLLILRLSGNLAASRESEENFQT